MRKLWRQFCWHFKARITIWFLRDNITYWATRITQKHLDQLEGRLYAALLSRKDMKLIRSEINEQIAGLEERLDAGEKTVKQLDEFVGAEIEQARGLDHKWTELEQRVGSVEDAYAQRAADAPKPEPPKPVTSGFKPLSVRKREHEAAHRSSEETKK